jgi:hypothetical protein
MPPPSPETLARLGREKLLAFCESQRLRPDPNWSSLELAKFICDKLGDTDPGAIGPFSAVEATLFRVEMERRLDKLTEVAARFPVEVQRMQQEVSEALKKAELGIHQASANATVQFTQSATAAQKSFHDALHQGQRSIEESVNAASLRCKEMEGKAELAKEIIKQADAQYEKRQSFLQRMTQFVLGGSGVVTVLIAGMTLFAGYLVNQELGEVRRLAESARNLQQTNETAATKITLLAQNAERIHGEANSVAGNLKKTDSDLKSTYTSLQEYLFLSVSERCQQIAEKTSFRLSPEDIQDIRRELEELEPFLSAAAKSLNTNSSQSSEVELYRRLESYRMNIWRTLPVTDRPMEDKSPELMSDLGIVLQLWESYPNNILGFSEAYSNAVSVLGAHRENMLGSAKLLMWVKRQGNELELAEITNHYTRAIGLDRRSSRPLNSLAVVSGLLLGRELRSTNVNGERIRSLYTNSLHLLTNAYGLTSDPRMRLRLLNNQATIHYRFAEFLCQAEGKTNEANLAYQECRRAISKGYQLGVSDSNFLETHAESLGVEFLINESECQTDREERQKRETKILGLLTAAKDATLKLGSGSNYLTRTGMRHVTNNPSAFSQKLEEVLSGRRRVDLR